MTKRFVKTAISALVLLVLGGCAWTEDTVEVSYRSAVPGQSIGADGKQVTLKVTDARIQYKGSIGSKTNGYGQRTAAIRSTKPVGEIVRGAFVQELTERELQVAENTDLTLSVAIKAMHNNFLISGVVLEARSTTTLVVQVRKGGDTVLYQDVASAVYVENGVLTAAGDSAARSLEASLRDAMAALFTDPAFIDALIRA